MSACVITFIFGKKFKTVYPSVKNYDSYIFTNNFDIKNTVEKEGWKFIYIDFPLSDDDAVSSFQSKYIKYLQFLKDESLNYFWNYDKIVITDHKNELKNSHVEHILKAIDNKNILVREQPLNRKNIWEEVGDAMFQERYLRFMPETIDYIREKLAAGYSEQPNVVWTSLIVYSHLEEQTIEFTDKIYKDLIKVGTSECQIIWAMIGQEYADMIKIIKWNSMEIKWEEPKEIDEEIENVTSEYVESNGITGNTERFLMRELKNKTAHVEQLLDIERNLKGEIQRRTDLFLENERRLKGELLNKTLHVEQLLISERELYIKLTTILSSRSWKIASKISSFSHILLPLNSKRRLFAKIMIIFIKHPFNYITKIKFKDIKRFFRVLKTEGTENAKALINVNIPDSNVPKYNQELYVLANDNSIKSIIDYEPIDFKMEDNPIVTIVIPVYNKFGYTYNCLKSILYNSGYEVSYEIIIADDCSNDLTTEIEKIVKNIKVIRTPENLRFLKNCNYAAKHTKGKYILFLNNDTQVQKNWLLPLIELIEKDDSIGAVGSKLIFDNGMLQEAGGIYWNDASAWNYGRMSNPDSPEFNYVKEVDYVSGAAFMIRKTVWEKLNGFDETFIPAYCEDADICFSIRENGYKVMYQPASVVVHFEGISNGNDISEGQKQYQAVNKKKFFLKWNNILLNEHFPNGDNVFHARDRSRRKKTLLLVDHYVPTFDKDAGSKAVFQYLQFFVNQGFNVKFIGDNFTKMEPYTGVLEQMGIEVLYGDYYYRNWRAWLLTNAQYINYVILSRPHIAIKYIEEVREKTNAKIIYYGHDLHFLREYREYSITGNIEKLESSEKWKGLELSLMKRADIAYYFSSFEAKTIKEIDPSIKCRIVPMYIFNVRKFQEYDKRRKNLLFVGGFAHNPNIDSLMWFVNEIFPLIRDKIPGIVLNVIGSNAPNKIKKLENNDIKILGYVGDILLGEQYKENKIFIAPLRYGAGVKGKVLEAMYNQIPVITTSIGAEGLPDIENCIIIEDNAEEFANKIIDIYDDKESLNELEVKGFDYIMKNFTAERVKEILKEDFE